MVTEVDAMRADLFSHDIHGFIQKSLAYLEEAAKEIVKFDAEELKAYMESMENFNAFMTVKDYLSMSDVIKFEIDPLIQKRRGQDVQLQ